MFNGLLVGWAINVAIIGGAQSIFGGRCRVLLDGFVHFAFYLPHNRVGRQYAHAGSEAQHQGEELPVWLHNHRKNHATVFGFISNYAL